jgi:hypothetical protein
MHWLLFVCEIDKLHTHENYIYSPRQPDLSHHGHSCECLCSHYYSGGNGLAHQENPVNIVGYKIIEWAFQEKFRQTKERTWSLLIMGANLSYIPGCKPRKPFFHLLATIQIFNSCFINSPDEDQFNDVWICLIKAQKLIGQKDLSLENFRSHSVW